MLLWTDGRWPALLTKFPSISPVFRHIPQFVILKVIHTLGTIFWTLIKSRILYNIDYENKGDIISQIFKGYLNRSAKKPSSPTFLTSATYEQMSNLLVWLTFSSCSRDFTSNIYIERKINKCTIFFPSKNTVLDLNKQSEMHNFSRKSVFSTIKN